MLSHAQIWSAIDALAQRNGLSASGLARRAGLDPTTFNRSKRIGADGRERWPSTESLAKALEATRTAIDDFTALIVGPPRGGRMLPLVGFAQAGAGGFFDDGGFPVGTGWDEVPFPGEKEGQTYAIEVQGDSMQPVYREGDTLVVSPTAPIRRGDRVVVRTTEGEIMAKELRRRTAKVIELGSLNKDHPERIFAPKDISWMARILWASQ